MSDPYEYYRSERNIRPIDGGRYNHPYGLEGAELQSLIGENPEMFTVLNFDLSVAQAFTSPLSMINVSGQGLVIYGHTTATVYNPLANTGIETVVSTVFMACRFQNNLGGVTQNTNEFHLKHNRGFRGPFTSIFLAWPAQANNSCKLYIFKSRNQAFSCGEAAT